MIDSTGNTWFSKQVLCLPELYLKKIEAKYLLKKLSGVEISSIYPTSPHNPEIHSKFE